MTGRETRPRNNGSRQPRAGSARIVGRMPPSTCWRPAMRAAPRRHSPGPCGTTNPAARFLCAASWEKNFQISWPTPSAFFRWFYGGTAMNQVAPWRGRRRPTGRQPTKGSRNRSVSTSPDATGHRPRYVNVMKILSICPENVLLACPGLLSATPSVAFCTGASAGDSGHSRVQLEYTMTASRFLMRRVHESVEAA
jgi:hypothetical protein